MVQGGAAGCDGVDGEGVRAEAFADSRLPLSLLNLPRHSSGLRNVTGPALVVRDLAETSLPVRKALKGKAPPRPLRHRTRYCAHLRQLERFWKLQVDTQRHALEAGPERTGVTSASLELTNLAIGDLAQLFEDGAVAASTARLRYAMIWLCVPRPKPILQLAQSVRPVTPPLDAPVLMNRVLTIRPANRRSAGRSRARQPRNSEEVPHGMPNAERPLFEQVCTVRVAICRIDHDDVWGRQACIIVSQDSIAAIDVMDANDTHWGR